MDAIPESFDQDSPKPDEAMFVQIGSSALDRTAELGGFRLLVYVPDSSINGEDTFLLHTALSELPVEDRRYLRDRVMRTLEAYFENQDL